jgi:hypothetical protein
MQHQCSRADAAAARPDRPGWLASVCGAKLAKDAVIQVWYGTMRIDALSWARLEAKIGRCGFFRNDSYGAAPQLGHHRADTGLVLETCENV